MLTAISWEPQVILTIGAVEYQSDELWLGDRCFHCMCKHATGKGKA